MIFIVGSGETVCTVGGLRVFLRLFPNFLQTVSSVVLCVLRALFGVARFTVRYVRAVGQDVSPGKGVLLSTGCQEEHEAVGRVCGWKALVG